MHSRRRSHVSAKDRRRFSLLAAEVGCLACNLDGRLRVPADLHHPIGGGELAGGGGYRRGSAVLYPLCPWHHRGVFPDGLSALEAAERFGPSLARAPRAFRDRYGSDDDLLEYASDLLAIVEARVV